MRRRWRCLRTRSNSIPHRPPPRSFNASASNNRATEQSGAGVGRRSSHGQGVVVADSWFSDSKLMRQVATTHQGTFLVEGKNTYVFALPDECQVKGHDLQQHHDWPWRHSPHVSSMRYARLRATSPTYSTVTLIVVSAPKKEQFYLMCLETTLSGPRLIQVW